MLWVSVMSQYDTVFIFGIVTGLAISLIIYNLWRMLKPLTPREEVMIACTSLENKTQDNHNHSGETDENRKY